MKTISKVIIISLLAILVLNAKAQNMMRWPSCSFQSTSSSSMRSGSALQSAAIVGYESADDFYVSTISHQSARRARVDEEEIITNPDLPTEVSTPIGDGQWILLLMSIAFAQIRPIVAKWSSSGSQR